jgi:hypothetical protein
MHSIDRSMCDVPLEPCRAQLGVPGTRRRREISLSQMQTTAPCSASSSCWQARLGDWQASKVLLQKDLRGAHESRHVKGNPGFADGVTASPADRQRPRAALAQFPSASQSSSAMSSRAGRHAHARQSGTRIALIQSDPQCGRSTEP